MIIDMIDLNRLEHYKENNRIEAKKALGGLPHSLWETYSAFANTLGGILLLGVEEQKDRTFFIHNLPNPQQLVDEFFSIITQKKYVSVNLLSQEQVQIVTLNGKKIIAVDIPRAPRTKRPVYIGTDVYTGSYRRDGEGDYHCSREEIEHMLREAKRQNYGNELLKHSTMQVFDACTIARYREYLKRERPGHVWQDLEDEIFLEKLGAVSFGVDGRRCPVTAGLLMFGKEKEIIKKYPCYALHYQELDSNGIWSDRIISDAGDWSGNLFDFFCRVSKQLTKKISLPYNKEKRKNQETPVHKAIREMLANCLVHADYEAKQGVLVQKSGNKILFENPGSFGIDREQAVKGGMSNPRNPVLIKMFHLINIGNGEGRGVAEVYSFWKAQGWAMPSIKEEFQPERTQISLELMGEEQTGNQRNLHKIRKKAAEIIYESQKQQVIDYVTVSMEISAIQAAHLLDIGKPRAKQVLARMTGERILEQKGQKRSRTYQLKA